MNIISKITFIYLVSMILLTFLRLDRERSLKVSYIRHKTHPFLKERQLTLNGNLTNKTVINLTLGYLFGLTRGIPKKVKKNHQVLGLKHLFTPSGIHLSSCLLLLWPISHFLKIRWASLIVCLFLFFLPPGFYSLKRLALFRWTIFLGKKYLDIYYIFLISFLADFMFGTFTLSPISFTYSFLFLGTILAHRRPKIYLPFALWGCQIIISFFNESLLTRIGPILNFILTGIFAFIYPIIFVSFWTSLYGILEITIEVYYSLVSICAYLALISGKYQATLFILIIPVIFSLKISSGLKKWSLFALLLMNFEDIRNSYPKRANYAPQKSIYSMPPQSDLLEVIYSNKGQILKFENNIKCLATLRGSLNQFKCYQLF